MAPRVEVLLEEAQKEAEEAVDEAEVISLLGVKGLDFGIFLL